MAQKVEFRYYQNKYYQGTMTEEQAGVLIDLVNNYSEVTSLKHVIKNVPNHVVKDMIEDYESYEKKNGTIKGFSKEYEGLNKVGTLLPYQTVGAAFMYYAGSALLGDEVGLGKTVQVAALAMILKEEFKMRGKDFRFCFLAEKSSASEIREKLVRFTGEFVGLLPNGGTGTVEKYIDRNKDERNYSIVGTHALLTNAEFLTDAAKRPFDLIIVDEGSVLKNTTSTIHKKTKALFKYHKRKVILNATPLETSVRDIYNQLVLLDTNYLPTVTEFNKQFTKVKYTPFGFKPDGFKNADIFKEAISLRYLARTREELGAEYGDNIFKTILVPLSPEQKSLINKTSLKQMVVDYPTGVDRRVPFNELTTPKLAVLLKIIEEMSRKENNKVLVYCHYIEAQKEIKTLLEEKGYRVAVLNGQKETATAHQRSKVAQDFDSGMYDVLITNILRGIDINNCDCGVVYSLDGNPQKLVQFEGRMTREFDVVGKSIYLLVSMGREKKRLDESIKLRVDASAAFTKVGNSLVLKAIRTEDNKEIFELDGD